MDETWVHHFQHPRDEATIEAVQIPRFFAFQESQDCDVHRQDDDPIFWKADGVLLVDYLNYQWGLLYWSSEIAKGENQAD